MYITNFFILPQGLNFRLAFAILSGAFGSAFQHGYNTGVLNAPQKLITEWIGGCNTTLMKEMDLPEDEQNDNLDLSECVHGNGQVILIWSWIVASFCVGGIMGGSAIGVVVSRLGRSVVNYHFSLHILQSWAFAAQKTHFALDPTQTG